MPNRVYIFHKNGANSHYVALEKLLNKHKIEIKFYEFSVIGKILKSITKFQPSLFVRQIQNIKFILFLLFTKNQKVLLGIAPYDKKIKSLSWLLKNHQVYYHTSWCCWDKSFQPKKIKSKKVLEDWRCFLEEQVKHIFCVTSVAQNQILENYNIDKTITSVVLHSLKPDFSVDLTSKTEKTKNSFICIGRLIPAKGIEEILEYFKNNPSLSLTLVGDGSLKIMAESYSEDYNNINFLGKISNTKTLKKLLAQHQYLLLNSIKTSKWEELFGIVIIEAMSQGTIPISSNHPGPKDIINQSIGILFEEGKLTETLDKIDLENYPNLISDNGRQEAEKYTSENISQLWKVILD